MWSEGFADVFMSFDNRLNLITPFHTMACGSGSSIGSAGEMIHFSDFLCVKCKVFFEKQQLFFFS